MPLSSSGSGHTEHDLVSISPQHSEMERALLFLENPILCSRKNKSLHAGTCHTRKHCLKARQSVF